MQIINVLVTDIDGTLAAYDAIAIQRSVGGSAGPWVSLTSLTSQKAVLLGELEGPFNVSGLTLILRFDRQEPVTTTFSGINPLSAATVASQINTAAGRTIVSAEEDDSLKLQPLALLGTASEIEVEGGTAVTLLGFEVGQRDIGAESFISLIPGISTYRFVDYDGQPGDYYRFGFIHTTALEMSAWSDPFLGTSEAAVSEESLSLCQVDLVDAQGLPVSGQRITFFPLHKPLVIEGFALAMGSRRVTIETDHMGHAEVSLIRGLQVRVVFEGTSLIRDILVPDADSFDLLSAVGEATDPYDVAKPNLPVAPRRTT